MRRNTPIQKKTEPASSQKNIKMRNLEITIDTAKFFKRSYSCKMGGTQTIVFPGGETFDFDDRDYYSGRGAKYNSSIRHDSINVIVTVSELKAYEKRLRDQDKAIKLRAKEQAAYNKMVADAAKAGVYSLNYTEGMDWVNLSREESEGRYFDEKRLAATFKISVEDAQLLNSKGKTYVFAKSEDGNTYMFYHASLDWNSLAISFKIATPELMSRFDHKEWASAPYADLLGQTDNKNHFVC